MRHGIRILIAWLIASAIGEILVAILPIPSPANSPEAAGAHQTIYMLFYVGTPIFMFVWVLLVYDLIAFRATREDEEAPAPPDSTPILLLWAGISFIVVLFMAGWGTFTIHEITQAPKPVLAASTSKTHGKSHPGVVAQSVKPLEVQVIGQEWIWTFRYPSYGAMETRDLYIPVNTPIDLHITSLDVVHSFWSYDYDVKEDAVPGVDNQAWMLAKNTSSFTPSGKDWIKCNELCGIWHGYMRVQLHVLTKSAFQTWAAKQFQAEKSSGLLNVLPRYAPVYYPAANSNWPPVPQDQSP
jgi:cytochrome c oxidase subunit 2